MIQKKSSTRKLIFGMISIIFLSLFIPTAVKAASSVTIEYDGNTVKYSGQKVVYSIDGVSIPTTYPGIIIDGISLAPCKAVFYNSSFGVTYTETAKTATLKKNNITIQFTLGSKTAKVNGKNKSLSLAPRMITFKDTGKSEIYVPARFVAETFGYQYNWNPAAAISNMKTPALSIKYDGRTTSYTGKNVIFQTGGVNLNNGTAPGVNMGGETMIPAESLFTNKRIGATYKYSSKSGKITISKGHIKVDLEIGSKTAYINGEKQKLAAAPKKITYNKTGKTYVCVPARFVAEALGYAYSYNSSQGIVTLTAPWYLKYDGDWVAYQGSRGKLTVDGSAVKLSPMDSFMIDETLMTRAKALTDALGCSYEYDSKKKTLTVATEDTTIVFLIDQDKAFVNGIENSIITPARKVTNGDNNTVYTMIPIRFTATTLGYTYKWDEKTATSIITSPKESEEPDEDPVPEPPTDVYPDASYFNWPSAESYKAHVAYLASLNPVHSLSYREWTDVSAEYASIYSIAADVSALSNLYDSYTIQSQNSFYGINSELTAANQLILNFDHAISVNASFPFTNTVTASSAGVTVDSNALTTKVVFNLTVQNPAYEIALSADGKTMYLKIYRTCISNVEAYSKNNNDILKISGTGILKPAIVVDTGNPDLLTITVPGAFDTIGANVYAFENAHLVQNVTYIPMNDMTQILIYKTPSSDYYIEELGNSFEVHFSDMESIDYSLKIPLEPGTDINSVVDNDLYHKNQFLFTLPGDQTAYLSANPVVTATDVVKNTAVTLNSSGNTEVRITTTKLQAYRIHNSDGAIMLEIDDPKNLYDKIVVFDAGHGGKDPGTQHFGYSEKNLTLQIIYDQMLPLMNKSDIKAYWTRTDDTFIELVDRAKFSSKVGADLFISMHINAFTSPSPNGLSVFYATGNTSTNSGGLSSSKLAGILQTNLIAGLKPTDRKVKTERHVVTNQNSVPAVLIELGFISNPDEVKKLVSSSYQKKTAEILYNSLIEIFNKYPSGR